MELIKNGILQVTDIFGTPFLYHPVKTDKTRYPMKATTVTLHNTGNPKGDELAHTKYVDALEAYTDWHFTVGPDFIYQELSINVNAWHAADGGSGKGNRTSIAIELVETGDFEKTKENAIKLCYMLKLCVPTLDNNFLKMHKDWKSKAYPNGKNCPRLILAEKDGWNVFVNRYVAYAKQQSYDGFTDVKGHYAQASLEKLIRKASLLGYPDKTFRPNVPMTRAEFAIVLDRLGTLD